MDIIKKIEQDLKHSEEASIIYEFDKSEKDLYRKTIAKIDDIEDSEEYGYIDVNVYSNSLNFIEKNNCWYNELNDPALTRKFLYDHILRQIESNREYLSYDSYYEKYSDRIKSLELRDFIKLLNIKAKKSPSQKVRIHFFIDSIENPNLQIAINDLIASKSIITRVYTTKDLLTKETSAKQILTHPFDYTLVESYERQRNNSYQRVR